MTAKAETGFPRLHRMGEAGLLIEFGDGLSMSVNAAVLAFRAALDAAAWPGVEESATSLKSVFLRFDPDLIGHDRLEYQLRDLLASHDWYGEGLPAGRSLWRVPTLFGGAAGPQLEETAALAGVHADDVVDAICGAPLRVLTIGFAPGLPYLGELPEAFDIPRKTELNPNVPGGGLALAIRQLVLFPVDTQTGWRWIARAALDVFGQRSDTPFPLTAGDEILFQPVTEAAFEDAWREVTAGHLVATREALP